jgi:hypothetical protein
MSASDVNASIEIRSGRQGGMEPWGQTATLELDLQGFRDTEGVGRGGDEPGVLAVSSVCATLLETFDRTELCALLDHIVALRDSLQA